MMFMEYIIDHINNYPKEELYAFYNQIKPFKKHKISLLKKEEDKLSSILGEYLLSKLLKKNHIKYSDINIVYNENGKPYIESNPLYYNISHKDGFVSVVVSNKECGIDIETIKDKNINLDLFASNKEKDYINGDKERLFEIYTLKEATLKMYGKSLLDIKNINTNNVKKKIIKEKDYIVTIIEPED